MVVNKKILLTMVMLLMMTWLVVGCGTNEDDAAVSSPISAQMADSALQQGGDIAVTPELREQYLQLAQDMRWDFLPVFDKNQSPVDAEAYLPLVYAQQLTWNEDGSLSNDGDMSISADYVADYISRHFGVEVKTPEPGSTPARFDFDGEKYTPGPDGWKVPPLYEVESIHVENENGKIVYCVVMNEYDFADGNLHGVDEVESAKSQIISGNIEESTLEQKSQLTVYYFVNDRTDDIVYEAVSNIPMV